jgi:pyridoxine/pyridoxamine 5'-phosphate oxidase
MMTNRETYEFMSKPSLAVLATLSPANQPQSALIGIAVTPNLEIIFDTLSISRKYANLIANPRCSLVIGWEGEITLQYEGTAAELNGPESDSLKEVYYRKWPDGRARAQWPNLVYFVVRPNWIRYSNFDHQPATIQEFNF